MTNIPWFEKAKKEVALDQFEQPRHVAEFNVVGVRPSFEIEHDAMARIYQALSSLKPTARMRVMRYVSEAMGDE